MLIKIKNPFSISRYSKIERLERKFSRLVIPIIKKLPVDYQINKKPWYLPKAIYVIGQTSDYKEKFSDKEWVNAKPSHLDLNLISISTSDYIPIEDIDKLEKGLHKLFKIYKPKLFDHDSSRIKDFCNEVSQNIHGGSWSLFGTISIGSNSKLSKFVESIEISATHLSSSSIILGFNIRPSEKFIYNYKNIMEKNIGDETTLKPRFKNFFTFWNNKTIPGESAKARMIEDLMLELKWQTLKEISKHINIHFTDNRIVTPSIEVYKISRDYCSSRRVLHDETFLRSIGLKDSYEHEMSVDGYWEIYGLNTRTIDSSIKVTCNSRLPQELGYGELNFQIYYMMKDFSNILLPVLIMRNYTISLSKNIAKQQKETFAWIRSSKPNYNKLIKIRYDLERNIQILKRFKNEIDEKDFTRFKHRIKKSIGDFEQVEQSPLDKGWTEITIENTEFWINNTFNHTQNFSEIIDGTVRLLELKTNNSLRKQTFRLTIFTVVLSLLATSFAGFSLYSTIDEDIQKDILLKVMEVKQIIIDFFIG